MGHNPTVVEDAIFDQIDAVIQQLVARRKDLGLSKADVANLIGVARSTYWRWENGTLPNIEYLFTWANKLKCRIIIAEEKISLAKFHTTEAPSTTAAGA